MRAIRRITTILVVFGLGVAAGFLPALLAQSAPKEDQILFEPAMSVGPDPFTPPATRPSGPFGGSGSDEVCDPEQLIRFLQENPVRLRAWADVQGIEAHDVPEFIRSLRPVVLEDDTRVTNHSFSDGRAQPFQSMLEAGTSVLVDEDDKPRVRCRCGNPLDEPRDPPEKERCPEHLVALHGEDCVPDEQRDCPEHLVALHGEDCVPDEQRDCPTHLIALYGEGCVPDEEECPPDSSIHGYDPDCPTPPPPPRCPQTHILAPDCDDEPGNDPQPDPQPEPEPEPDPEPEPEPDDEEEPDRPDPPQDPAGPSSISGPSVQ